ncbi:Slit And Ntrk-Like Protein 1, partial [Manis pentadactyla]
NSVPLPSAGPTTAGLIPAPSTHPATSWEERESPPSAPAGAVQLGGEPSPRHALRRPPPSAPALPARRLQRSKHNAPPGPGRRAPKQSSGAGLSPVTSHARILLLGAAAKRPSVCPCALPGPQAGAGPSPAGAREPASREPTGPEEQGERRQRGGGPAGRQREIEPARCLLSSCRRCPHQVSQGA